jgi:hypothetical protein
MITLLGSLKHLRTIYTPTLHSLNLLHVSLSLTPSLPLSLPPFLPHSPVACSINRRTQPDPLPGNVHKRVGCLCSSFGTYDRFAYLWQAASSSRDNDKLRCIYCTSCLTRCMLSSSLEWYSDPVVFISSPATRITCRRRVNRRCKNSIIAALDCTLPLPHYLTHSVPSTGLKKSKFMRLQPTSNCCKKTAKYYTTAHKKLLPTGRYRDE